MTDQILTNNLDLQKIIYEASTTVTYVGLAKIGALKSEAKWQIFKITKSATSTPITTEVAFAFNSNSIPSNKFEFVWDDGAGLDYSTYTYTIS